MPAFNVATLRKDIPSSIAVFLVAVPLCLGIALASGVPPISGLIAGIVGGLVVGSLSGSHTSVAGPAAGLVAIVLGALADLGSLELFLLAVFLSGLMQIGLGLVRAGGIALYFPNAVIRGLLAAIGIILILKEIPLALGYTGETEGKSSWALIPDALAAPTTGAVIITFVCLGVMLGWERSERLRKLPLPAPLAAAVVGVAINQLYVLVAPDLALIRELRITLPEFGSVGELMGTIARPDFSGLSNQTVWVVAVTLAIVASLETLLNIEAADKLDRHRRVTPPNRELLAQGVGNTASGLLGGLPVTSVIIRSSVNIHSGAESRTSTILHGTWLITTLLMVPWLLEMIPLSALAAILIVTGFKLANPKIFMNMWRRGMPQFVTFVVTVVGIVATDLLVGIGIGLAVGIGFVIRSLLTTPFLVESDAKPAIGQPARMKLAQQVTFLHRARLIRALEALPRGTELVIDASKTEYIDADVIDIIRSFRDVQAGERDIRVSLVGFNGRIDSDEEKVQYVDVFTKERQRKLSAESALEVLCDGNRRFANGESLERDYRHQLELTTEGQHPIAAVLGCIDSRAPAEIVFDKGIGDMFAVRVAGNVLNDDVIGSLEYAAEVAGVKVILVLGHTRCGAIGAACQGVELGHVTGLIRKLKPAVDAMRREHPDLDPTSHEMGEHVARENVRQVLIELVERSSIIRARVESGALELAGGIYSVETGAVELLSMPSEERARAASHG